MASWGLLENPWPLLRHWNVPQPFTQGSDFSHPGATMLKSLSEFHLPGPHSLWHCSLSKTNSVLHSAWCLCCHVYDLCFVAVCYRSLLHRLMFRKCRKTTTTPTPPTVLGFSKATVTREEMWSWWTCSEVVLCIFPPATECETFYCCNLSLTVFVCQRIL